MFCNFLFVECDEWNACYLCATISFKEFTSNVVTDGDKTQRYDTCYTVWVTPVSIDLNRLCGWHFLIIYFLIFLSSATCALVSSRDLHWSLHASKDVKDINLGTIRMLLLADRANPCEYTALINEHAEFILYTLYPCTSIHLICFCLLHMTY